jgi:predicted RNase H-like nuclease
MFYIGADGCKEGWLAVKLSERNSWSVRVFKTINDLWQPYKHAKLILIDIPIGLRDGGNRERICDQEARKLLGSKRRSSVFPVPCRPAVYAGTYDIANRISKELTDRGLSMQAWWIISKIKQVDHLLLSDKAARSRIREIHPEVCFWALNGQKSMEYPKRKKTGYDERMEVLRSVFPQTDNLVNNARQKYQDELKLRKLAKDDILDALVAAVTASEEGQGLSTIPEKPEVDSEGLPMEMVYVTI